MCISRDLGKLGNSGLQVGCDYLAYLVSWFSTFCKLTASQSSFISSFTLPLSWCLRFEIVQRWGQPQILSLEIFSSAFRSGCIKGGPAIKGGSYAVTCFLPPIRGTNTPAHGFSVLRKPRLTIWTNRGTSYFTPSMVLVSVWDDFMVTSQHTCVRARARAHTHTHCLSLSLSPSFSLSLSTCASPRMVKWYVYIFTINRKSGGR